MNEKQAELKEEKSAGRSSTTNAGVADSDQPLEHILQRLPSEYRQEILKQYDLPVVKVSIMTIFRYGTPLEYAMQIIGLLFAIAAGKFLPTQLFARTAVDSFFVF